MVTLSDITHTDDGAAIVYVIHEQINAYVISGQLPRNKP